MAEIETNIPLLFIMGMVVLIRPLRGAAKESRKGTRTMPRNAIALVFIATLLAACARPEAEQKQSMDVGVLMFGDSGYHLDYPDQDDYEELFNAEEYQQKEWADWLEDKRPREEFEARPSAISPVTKKVVPATGMHAISVAMRDYCANRARCDFGVMLGDNIYPSGATFGADGFDDDLRFKHILGEPFGNIVDTPEDYKTYVALGNHDWETSRDAGFLQIEYLEDADGFYMDGPYYSVKPPAGNGDIELFVIDTSMMLASVPVNEDTLNDDGSEALTGNLEPPDYFVEPMTDEERNMHEWLERSLAESTARWKFVIAHHPIWSSAGSKFEQARALRELILPAMCLYADAYIVGHDHTLEIHTDDCERALGAAVNPPLLQVVSGAAAKQRPLHTSFMAHQARKYPEHETLFAAGLLWGFMHMKVGDDSAKVTVMSVPDDGSSDISVLFEYEFPRRSHRSYD